MSRGSKGILSAAAVIERAGDVEGMAKAMYYEAQRWPGHEDWNDWETNAETNKKEWVGIATAVSRFILEGK